jgi:hypothetical protein
MSLNREGNYIRETYNNEIERMETFVEYENKNSLSESTISSIIIIDGESVGYFKLTKNIDGVYTLSIEIEDDYQNKGYSLILLKNFCIFMNKYRNILDISYNTILYIDTDASENENGDSYWRNVIGMNENRYYENRKGSRKINGKGYEMSITLEKLINVISIKLGI